MPQRSAETQGKARSGFIRRTEAEHGGIPAEARCLQNACSRGLNGEPSRRPPSARPSSSTGSSRSCTSQTRLTTARPAGCSTSDTGCSCLPCSERWRRSSPARPPAPVDLGAAFFASSPSPGALAPRSSPPGFPAAWPSCSRSSRPRMRSSPWRPWSSPATARCRRQPCSPRAARGSSLVLVLVPALPRAHPELDSSTRARTRAPGSGAHAPGAARRPQARGWRRRGAHPFGTAELVLAVWALVFLGLGEWRTATRSA
jgi:hypothetical protein